MVTEVPTPSPLVAAPSRPGLQQADRASVCRCLASAELACPGGLSGAGLVEPDSLRYVINASELEQAQRTAEQLQEALDSRILIEQAKGILAADGTLGMDKAYQVLRRHARSHNASLRAVAEAVVNLGLRPR